MPGIGKRAACEIIPRGQFEHEVVTRGLRGCLEDNNILEQGYGVYRKMRWGGMGFGLMKCCGLAGAIKGS